MGRPGLCISSTLNGRRQPVGNVPSQAVLDAQEKARKQKRREGAKVSFIEAAKVEIYTMKEQRAQAIASVVHAHNASTEASVRETLKRALEILRSGV